MKRGCEQISHLASDSLERALTWRERLSIRIHFLMCSACRHYAANIAKLHRALQVRNIQGLRDLRLPEDKRAKMKNILKDVGR